jgi:hypothetical protein
MLAFEVDQASVTEVTDYLEQTRQNILAGIRQGMQEAMEGLSWTVADKLQGSPIVSRSGKLLGRVLASPTVTATPHYIKGTVDAELGLAHLGLWLEAGTNVPAIPGKLFQFVPADGASVFTHGHAAFQVKAHPFMNVSLNQYKPTLLDIITGRIAEATHGTV